MLEKLRLSILRALLPDHVKQVVSNSRDVETAFLPTTRNPPKYGTTALLNAYSSMPWLRAIVGKVSQTVGTTEWKLFVRQDGNGKAISSKKIQYATFEKRQKYLQKQDTLFSLVELEDHPLTDLLLKGNPRFLGYSVFQLTQQHLDLVGEAFWIIERNMLGTPVAIWPTPPDWVVELPSKDSPFYRIRVNHQQREVPVTEVIHFIDPNPSDPYGRGVSVARSLADELESDEYASKHIKSFFYNRARPDLIVSGEKLNRDDTKRLEEGWLSKHEGFWKAFKPYFINRKIDVKEIGQSFQSMQMVDLRKFERDLIIQVFGIPMEKLSVLTASNRSTILSADMFWTKDVILPRLELLRNVLQQKLVPMFDDRLILDFESPVVEDKEHTLDVMRAMPSAFTKNEWRAAANKESLGERGDTFVFRPGELEVPVDGDLVDNSGPGNTGPQDQGNGENQNAFTDLEILAELNPDYLVERVAEKLHKNCTNSS